MRIGDHPGKPVVVVRRGMWQETMRDDDIPGFCLHSSKLRALFTMIVKIRKRGIQTLGMVI